MKKLIFKKFFNNITIFFLISAFSLGLIVWIIQAVNYLDLVSEDGHNLKIYFYYTILSSPKIISKILIYVFFVSIFYNLIKLEDENELIIFWTNGINKIEFTNKLIRYSLMFFLIQLLLTTYIVPISQNKARSFIRSSNIDYFASMIKERKFIDTVKDLTMYINNKNGEELEEVFLKDQLSDNKFQIIYAKKGITKNVDNTNYLILFDGKIINNDNGEVNSFSFKKTEFNLSKYKTKTTTHPKIQETDSITLFNCFNTAFKIFKTDLNKLNDKNFNCYNNIYNDVFRELLRRIYLPIYIPLISLIACLVIIKSKNDNNYTKYKFILFFLGTLAVVISEVSIKYAGNNNLKNIIFFSIPIILFLISYGFILKKNNQ